jgi:5-enolpyruvylshikimate-3-phosphate synthase
VPGSVLSSFEVEFGSEASDRQRAFEKIVRRRQGAAKLPLPLTISSECRETNRYALESRMASQLIEAHILSSACRSMDLPAKFVKSQSKSKYAHLTSPELSDGMQKQGTKC